MPWPLAAVRAAWAVSMTEVEEGRICWDDTTQWSLNRVSSSQIVVLNSQNLNTATSKTRVCNFFNDGSCNSDSHISAYLSQARIFHDSSGVQSTGT